MDHFAEQDVGEYIRPRRARLSRLAPELAGNRNPIGAALICHRRSISFPLDFALEVSSDRGRCVLRFPGHSQLFSLGDLRDFTRPVFVLTSIQKVAELAIVVAALASDCCNAAALPSPERHDFTVVRRISLSDQRAEHPPLRSRPPGVHESPAHRVHPGASTGCTRCRRRRPVAKRAQTIRTSMRNFYNVERIDPSRRRARRESVRWSRAEARTRSAGHMLQEHNSR